MKPFSLDEHLKKPERKVVTRNGRKVRIACVDRKDSDYEEICCYTINGECTPNAEKPNDLFFVPEKHEGWVNIYRDLGLGGMRCRCVFDSEEEAIRNRDTAAIATAKIEWEE